MNAANASDCAPSSCLASPHALSSMAEIAALAHWSASIHHPLFQRRAASDTTELRGECPRWIVDVLDAISAARCISRTELVNQLLAKEATQVLMEMNVVARVARGTPTLTEKAPDLREASQQ